jgi:CubicO group peptidase (beta-lactamase class C family)
VESKSEILAEDGDVKPKTARNHLARRVIWQSALAAILLGSLCARLMTADDDPASKALSQQVDEFLQTRKSPFAFSGAVLVALDGRVILNKAYGYAEAELGVSNRPEMIYRIGSLSKPVSAVATMALAERHQVSIDDPVCRYIRNCPAEWSQVLIRHLLSQTSGIPDLFNATPAAPVEATREAIDKAIKNAASLALDSEPGSKYVYRNFNYMLIGYIIEAATGRTWGEVLKSTVFEPAGMVDTAYDDVWAIVPRRARGYDIKDGTLRNTDYKDHSAFAPGGLRSTTADMWAFARAFLDGRLVQPATQRQMLTPALGDYGFGWQVKKFFGQVMFNHTGGIDGFASHLAVYPDRRIVIVVLSNIESEPAKLTACNIAAVLLTPDHHALNSCPDH